MKSFYVLLMSLVICAGGCSVLDSTSQKNISCRFDFARGFTGQHVSLFINGRQIIDRKELLTDRTLDLALILNEEIIGRNLTIKLVIDDNVHIFSTDVNEGPFFYIYITGSMVGLKQSHNPYFYL